MELYLYSAIWGLSAAGLAWYAAFAAQQATYVTLADGRRQERTIPLVFRLLLPLAPNFAPLFRHRMFAKAREKASRRLLSAGMDGLISGEELLSLQFLMVAIFGVFWILLVMQVLSIVPGRIGTALSHNAAIFKLAGLVLLYLYPSSWLNHALAARHREIQRALPFTLDLLTLSVEAGMDFMSALQRSIEKHRVTALGEEMLRVVRQIQLGKTRREALRNMIDRIRHPDITSVMGCIVQADELGVSIGAILRIQAEQVRRRRFERAEKLAHEAPVKLLFPLVFFIFPAVFLVLLGPVVMQMIRQGGI